MLAFDWSNPLALLLYLPGVALAVGAALKAYRWFSPSKPLLAFGHPQEHSGPGVLFAGGSDADFERQLAERERFRLSSLSVSYLIENKGTTALRNLTTGIRTRGGQEHQFEEWVVQILAARETAPVKEVDVPDELHAGLTDPNRAVNYLFWARFTDEQGRRWEAIYDPQERSLDYVLISRRTRTRKASRERPKRHDSAGDPMDFGGDSGPA